MRLCVLVMVVALGCGKSEPKPEPPAAPAPPPAPVAAAAPDAAPAPVAVAAPDAAPAKPLVATKQWPYNEWDRAEAIIFNHVTPGPGVPLYAYADDDGWNPNILERKAIEVAQGERAAGWVIETKGSVSVSKCPFPRHAVVLYWGDTPVASINFCFECGDLLVWPAFEDGLDWDNYDNWSKKDEAKAEKLWAYQEKVYKKLYPTWEAFFRDELGYSIIPPKWR
jgi:hypothetical protein